MRVYLCGLPAIREPGRSEAYAEAAQELARQGHEAVSPYTSGLDNPALSTDEALDADAVAFAQSDAVVMIGAYVECYETITAKYAGKPVISVAELLRRAG